MAMFGSAVENHRH